MALGILGAVGNRVVGSIWSTTEERIHAGKPLLIDAREDPHGGGDGFAVAARSASGLDDKLGGIKGCDELMTSAKQAGAVDVYSVTEDLVLEGRTRRDVSIVDMRAKIVNREPPLHGASISCESAGAVGAIGILFDLDEDHPIARKILENGTGKDVHVYGQFLADGAYFAHGNIVRLTKSEIQPFEVIGVSKDSYVEWEIEADLIIDGKKQTISITNDGEPFRVTGASPDSGYERYYEYQWYKTPPRMYIGEKPGHPL